MLKKYLPTVITAALLVIALVLTAIFIPYERFEKTEKNVFVDAPYQAGMLLYGLSEAPYQQGDLMFASMDKGIYRYKCYGADGTPDKVEDGFDASGWDYIPEDGIIRGTDCRKIYLVGTDELGRVQNTAYYDFVPGVIYGYSNPDQYDDPLLYNAEQPSIEDERAIRLASNLFKSNKTAYYGTDYGVIIQGFLSKYGYMGGILRDYYHTGTDFTIHNEQPFYSPVDGELIFASGTDDYNMIAIYNEEKDITVFILHGRDIANAMSLKRAGTAVKIGDLLGYGGGAGEPAGDMHIHIEVRQGRVERYKTFSKDISYTRRTNYDPLVLADMFDLKIYSENAYEPFSHADATGFDGQNNSSVVLVGNWLYYIDKQNGGIYKSRPDGSQVTLLTATPAANLNYYGGWLYFSDLSKAGHLTKMTIDGSQPVTVTEVDTRTFVLVRDDYIYFANALHRNEIFRIRHDGTERKEILPRDVSHIFYYDNAIYYAQNVRVFADRIYKLDLNTLETVQLLESRADKPFVYEGMLCYRRYYSNKNCLAITMDIFDEAGAVTLIPAAYNSVLPGTRYITFTDENEGNSLYIKFLGKTEPVKLTNDLMCTELTQQGGWIYYYTPQEDGVRLTRINVYAMLKQRLNNEGAWVEAEFDAVENFAEIILASRTATEFPEDVAEATPMATPTPTPVITPVPTPTPEATPTPEGGEVTPTPEGGEGEATPTPEGGEGEATPTPEGGEGEATPTPEGGGEATPTPEGGEGEVTPTPEGGEGEATPTPEGGEGEATPTPTSGEDEATPTPAAA